MARNTHLHVVFFAHYDCFRSVSEVVSAMWRGIFSDVCFACVYCFRCVSEVLAMLSSLCLRFPLCKRRVTAVWQGTFVLYVVFAHVGCFRFLREVVPLFSEEYLVHIIVSMLIVSPW